MSIVPVVSVLSVPNQHAKTAMHGVDIHHLFRSATAFPRLLRPLHALLLVSGHCPSDIIFSTRLVNLYSRLGDTDSSFLTFRQMPTRNAFAWNTILTTYVRNNLFSDAVHCFYRFVTESTDARPDAFTFPVVIKACVGVEDGRRMHVWVLKLGLEVDLYVSASLIHMYTRFGLMDDARKLFDGMLVRDLGAWNAMISGFVQNGEAGEALRLFEEMMVEGGVGFDSVTLTSVLPVCVQLGELTLGLSIHVNAVKHGLDSEVYVSNALIDMYAKFGRVCDARLIFDGLMCEDLVSWNSIISAYGQLGDPITVFSLYKTMKERGFSPDALTLTSLASAISQAGDGLNARLLHGHVLRKGWNSIHIFISNAIIDMYAKLNNMEYAKCAFDRMVFWDVISWNTLITGYSQNGLANEAIDAFHKMQKHGDLVPNQGTLVAILPAYSYIGALQQGMSIHGRAFQIGLDLDLFVGTCLIDMYIKCGKLTDALLLFEQIPKKSSISWNTILAGHGIHGDGIKALELFERMQEEEVKPDQVTFLSLLSACSHAGLVDHGKRCFQLMHSNYGIEPIVKHYACMVDMLGRSGDLNAAYEFIQNMPLKPDAGVWGALLGACRIHGNVELGRVASKYLFEIDPENVGYYVLLSNMYARVGKWGEVDEVRNLVKEQSLKKTPGWSSIEVNNKVHVFFTGNQYHPQHREIYEELSLLMTKIKNIGFVADFSCVLQDVEEDEKEHILSSHSERLAIAFGIISTSSKTPIRIFKNLRVCVDCHNATKFISQITHREIVVRDSCRFHHFKDGTCSCGDYW